LLKHRIEQHFIGTKLLIDEFHNSIFMFDISAPNEIRQFGLIQSPFLISLLSERSNENLILPSDSTITISARSKNKDADLGKIRGTEIHSNAPEKFLYEFTRLSERNMDHAVCSTNYMQLTGENILN
jgi:hypothetical protein